MLAVVVVVVAVVVVLLGSRSGAEPGVGGGGSVTMTGGPSPGGPSPGGPATAPASASGSTAGSSPSASVTALVVHVVGAVERPGVVTLGSGSRVSVALERAGGATAEADLARLNLARLVQDGERLYVPRVGETDIPAALGVDSGPGGAAGGGDGGSPAAEAVVDLNTADQATLETLPGIGPGLAGRIIAWRDEHGRFAAVEDLLDVSGIGDGRFADLRDRVRV
ncbi:competence protein ComEA [Curtobacterium sp. UNCCL20]|nr:competence protein ComEA [Curtobacterium sp. UNCCL20]